MVCETPQPKDALTHQIWNSYLIYYWRYGPDKIILEMRSHVKVEVTQKSYVTLRLPKMHSHTKSGITASNNIGICSHKLILEARSDQGHRDPKTYVTHRNPKMHPHTIFGMAS